MAGTTIYNFPLVAVEMILMWTDSDYRRFLEVHKNVERSLEHWRTFSDARRTAEINTRSKPDGYDRTDPQFHRRIAAEHAQREEERRKQERLQEEERKKQERAKQQKKQRGRQRQQKGDHRDRRSNSDTHPRPDQNLKDALEILGLEPGAYTRADLKATYHRLVKANHTNTPGEGGTTRIMQLINTANDTVRNHHGWKK